MGRIGDIADLVTGLALLGGGYLIYRAVKDVGDIIPEGPGWPEWPTFEWPTFEIPALGDIIPDLPSPPPPEIPSDYLDAILRGGGYTTPAQPTQTWDPGDLTAGLGRIFQINGDLFGFRKAPGLEFGTRREARRYLRAYRGDLL